MADKENILPHLTCAAAKRAAASTSIAQSQPQDQPSAKRKRVALSELLTLSNAIIRTSPDLRAAPSKPRLRSKKEEDAEVSNIPPIDLSAAATDIDSNVDDPQMCRHYAKDIYQYLRSMEVEQKRRPLVNYIETIQIDVTANMRGVLVDWLVDVAEEYKLVSDTLYLTVSYIDRFLSFNALSR